MKKYIIQFLMRPDLYWNEEYDCFKGVKFATSYIHKEEAEEIAYKLKGLCTVITVYHQEEEFISLHMHKLENDKYGRDHVITINELYGKQTNTTDKTILVKSSYVCTDLMSIQAGKILHTTERVLNPDYIPKK